MSDAISFLTSLSNKYENIDIAWEKLLFKNYKTILQGSNPSCIDIGCHRGMHTDYLLKHLNANEVFIFEPIKGLFDELVIKYHSNNNVHCYNMALSNEEGELDFVHNTSAPAESGLKERTFFNTDNNILELVKVQVKKLDNVGILKKIDYIKIDCEGAELNILKGGAALLNRSRPLISVEYGPGGFDAYGYGPEDLFLFCESINYNVFDLFGNKFKTLDEWNNCVAKFYWDYILVPEEKASMVEEKFRKLPINLNDFLI